MDCHLGGPLTTENHVCRWAQGQVISIDMLPDDVLLEIFDCCSLDVNRWLYAWQTLVHVCRQWRRVVFESPHRLNLQLVCSTETPARDMPNIWPPLPLLINADESETSGVHNVVAALERSDRVREISITISSRSQSEEVWKVMQEPLPELTYLALESDDEVSIPPDSLLGGSAPRLRSLRLDYVPFPGLPKLLLSATNLAKLSLSAIPSSGYISPEAMVTGFSALTRLERLFLEFISPLSHPDRQSRRLPPPTRCVLPTLTRFKFERASEYLDDFVARIDVPRLNNFSIIFVDHLEIDTPHLVQFIRRTPYSKALGEAHITSFIGHRVMINLSCLPALPTLEDLYINDGRVGVVCMNRQLHINNHQWLELLRRFIYVKDLYVSKEFVPGVVSALQELIGDRTTEVLPILKNTFLEGFQAPGPVQEGIGQFVAARQLTRHCFLQRQHPEAGQVLRVIYSMNTFHFLSY